MERFANQVYAAATAAQMTGERGRFDLAEAKGLNEVKEAAKALGRDLLGANTGYRSDLSTTEYVRRLYETFLRRAPDSSAANWQTQADENGRSYVLEQFMGMSAYSERSGALYREILWLIDDQLGTPRLTAERTGKPEGVKRADYLPFGEEIGAGVGGRSVAQGYDQAMPRQTFSKKERDEETGLDYFLARYYSSAQGRFTSPDEFNGGPEELFEDVDPHDPLLYADNAEPQSLNKYQYCLGNPLRYIDPDGHQTSTADNLKNNSTLDKVQLGISIAGFIPGVGDVGDLVNAGISAARGNYKDAALDLVGAVPVIGSFISGGRRAVKVLSKADNAVDIAKNANKADNAVDTAKAVNIQANSKSGQAFSDKVAAGAKKGQTNVQREVTVKTKQGTRTRADVIATRNGTPRLIEAKASKTARLTKNQKKAFPEIAQGGAVVVGKGKPGYPRGTVIPPQRVRIIRGRNN